MLSGGKGSAVYATAGAAATAPTLQSQSSSAEAAVRAMGKTIAAGGAVAAAGNGAALDVRGVASFAVEQRRELVADQRATSVVVNVPGGLTSTSHVLATVQTNLGTVAVRAVAPNAGNGKVTIYLTRAAPGGHEGRVLFVFG